ncbi:hypothetical protein NEOC65_001066 [Neochlamydia sp. AcF65]|nr:hypothetical protein [Neochlamydia sp. AcF65]MBS4169804.1 hypothetical protein [Neochlamydia sp. AcF95]
MFNKFFASIERLGSNHFLLSKNISLSQLILLRPIHPFF